MSAIPEIIGKSFVQTMCGFVRMPWSSNTLTLMCTLAWAEEHLEGSFEYFNIESKQQNAYNILSITMLDQLMAKWKSLELQTVTSRLNGKRQRVFLCIQAQNRPKRPSIPNFKPIYYKFRRHCSKCKNLLLGYCSLKIKLKQLFLNFSLFMRMSTQIVSTICIFVSKTKKKRRKNME